MKNTDIEGMDLGQAYVEALKETRVPGNIKCWKIFIYSPGPTVEVPHLSIATLTAGQL